MVLIGVSAAVLAAGADLPGFRLWSNTELTGYQKTLAAKVEKAKIASEAFGALVTMPSPRFLSAPNELRGPSIKGGESEKYQNTRGACSCEPETGTTLRCDHLTSVRSPHYDILQTRLGRQAMTDKCLVPTCPVKKHVFGFSVGVIEKARPGDKITPPLA